MGVCSLLWNIYLEMLRMKINEEQMKELRSLCKKAVNQWGIGFQIDMVIEESLELAHSLFKYKRGKSSYDKVIEEAIDLKIMLIQLEEIFELYESTWRRYLNIKINNLRGLLNE